MVGASARAGEKVEDVAKAEEVMKAGCVAKVGAGALAGPDMGMEAIAGIMDITSRKNVPGNIASATKVRNLITPKVMRVIALNVRQVVAKGGAVKGGAGKPIAESGTAAVIAAAITAEAIMPSVQR